ncbi:hypothetical protein ACIBSW_10610 [Actinoplanes sp. NPDC049668]|uniref:hypothetical protein n=1 Tax=unclassified Actinoplanes TaxID=2626549 RepID=UPI0033BA996D
MHLPASPLFAVPEQSPASEFSNPDVARRVLEAVGGDARAYANIAGAVDAVWGPGDVVAAWQN